MGGHLDNAHVVVLFVCRSVIGDRPNPALPIRVLLAGLAPCRVAPRLDNAHVVVLFVCRLGVFVVSTLLLWDSCF